MQIPATVKRPAGSPAPLSAPVPEIGRAPLRALSLSVAHLAAATAPRIATGIAELDRVLGGGLVDGSFVLLGGDPGQGKSTLVLQAVHALCRTDRDGALYASAEESTQQVALRADRLNITNERISLAGLETGDEIEAVLDLASQIAPTVLVIDSVQAFRSRDLDSAPGSMAQVGAVAQRLSRFAKETQTPVIAIGQVTKDGELAGPKALEHLVDVVLYLEGAGGVRRRLVTPKNRHGSTDEVGLFEMRESGLASVEDPTAAALSERAQGVPGSAVFPAVVGERVQLVEIQALVGAPKGDDRPKGSLAASGVDPKRVQMILAVLARHARIDVTDRDVFVSVTAGARVADPAADLAIALAIASSARDLPIDPTCACFGELGLAGELRSVAYHASRSLESGRGGFPFVLSPGGDAKTLDDAIASAIGEAVRS